MTHQVRFDHYTDTPVRLAAELVNTAHAATGEDDLADLQALSRFAETRGYVRPRSADVEVVHALREQLRGIFAAGDIDSAKGRLNHLLDQFNSAPRLVQDEEMGLHVHFEPTGMDLGPWLGAITAVGLMFVICDYGVERIGLCGSRSCQRAYIDTSKNRRKRFCSEGCAHRESVAAYRARQRAEG